MEFRATNVYKYLIVIVNQVEEELNLETEIHSIYRR
jgi:hypothetical protein